MANVIVTLYTAARMAAIEAASVVSGLVNGGGHLILTKFDGSTIDAGYVVGPPGSGSIPSGSAGGDLTGTYPNPTVGALKITDAKVAAANKDGAVGTASMRTLGTGALQAAAGNDSRLSDSRAPTGAAGGVLAGTYPNPSFSDTGLTAVTTTGVTSGSVRYQVKGGWVYILIDSVLFSSLASGSTLNLVSAGVIPSAYYPNSTRYGAAFNASVIGSVSISNTGIVAVRADTGAMTGAAGYIAYPL